MTKRIAFLLAILFAVGLGSRAQRPTITVKLDSAYIQMGRVTPLRVEALGSIGPDARIVPADTGWVNVEYRDSAAVTRTDMGNGRTRLTQDLIIQSFDSGLYTLPPILLIDGGETIVSNRCVLKVVPVNVDSLRQIHDYAPVSKYPSRFFDFLPLWFLEWGVWVLLALILLAAGIWIYMSRKGVTPEIKAERKRQPPYEEAVQALTVLREQKLCERGEEKIFYTRMVDILRVYLQRRFGINAMEMTSTQIRHALASNEQTRPSRELVDSVLRMADFVKFAKMRPMPEDNMASFRSALEFVENTRPVPQPEAQPEAQSETQPGAQADTPASDSPKNAK